jgi:hypothetical protein
MFRSSILVVAILLSNLGFASHRERETVELSQTPFTLQVGNVKSVSMNDWHYVQKIFVEAWGVGSDGEFEVIANGDVKGTIYVPNRDPSYVVTIGETVRTLEFRHRSGGRIKVNKIKVVREFDSLPRYPQERGRDGDYGRTGYGRSFGMSLNARNQAASIARRAIVLSEQIEDYANYEEYGIYILPIKKAAARAYTVASARGDLSRRTATYLIALKAQIEYAYTYIDETFERDAAFELAVELMSLGRQLDDLLD